MNLSQLYHHLSVIVRVDNKVCWLRKYCDADPFSCHVNGLRVIGMPCDRGGVISFVMEGIPDVEVGKLLDAQGIAARTDHHCAQPILARFGLESSVRPSFAFYNTRDEVDVLVETLRKISLRQ